MSTFTLSRPAAAVSGKGFLETLVAMSTTYRQRAKLARLDTHLLQDIGISSSDAAFEAAKPVWNVPVQWKSC